MARTRLTNITDDINEDSGAVLWSLVVGEQLEYPVILDFIKEAGINYQYEAVVIEADNDTGQTDKPKSIRTAGVQVTLNIRVPVYRGNWDAPQAYNTADVVAYSGKFYEKLREAAEAVIDSTNPDTSLKWVETQPGKIHLQFPSTLGNGYAQAPEVDVPVYGFFELRVTEPSNYSFRRTWKPVRGMVELLFSPTHVVPDL